MLAAGVIEPPIWRRLVVDGRISLAKLHHYIQAAFGWTDYLHMLTSAIWEIPLLLRVDSGSPAYLLRKL